MSVGDIGDYDSAVHVGNYVSEYKLLLKQTEMIEEKIMEIHQKQLKGQSPSQAENIFLRIACQIDTYGIDPHPVKVHCIVNVCNVSVNDCLILSISGSQR